MLIDLPIFTERAVIAVGLGTLIGVERQLRQCTTGLRTNALVSLGSALFVLAGGFDLSVMSHQGRIVAQIVSGIGFVGAGVIMKDGAKVRGLNTAVTLWCSSCIGVLCGIGQTTPALIGTLLILASNIVLKYMSRHINMYVIRQQSRQESMIEPVIGSIKEPAEESPPAMSHRVLGEEIDYQLFVLCRKREEGQVRRLIMTLLNGAPLILRSLHTDIDEHDAGKVEVHADLIAYTPQQAQLEQIVSRMSLERGVSSVSWRIGSAGDEG